LFNREAAREMVIRGVLDMELFNREAAREMEDARALEAQGQAALKLLRGLLE
jgi:hypothetical protein